MANFFDYWGGFSTGLSYFRDRVSKAERFNTVYLDSTDNIIAAIYAVQGTPIFDSAIALSKNAKNVQKYMKVMISGVNLSVQNYLNGINPSWIVDVIEREHYNLAEHHLYGSARLGIKGYWPNQLYSLWDYSDTTAFIIDTTLLQSRQPWYSAQYQDGIKPDVTLPWNSTFVNPARMQTILGQKQYEETDHLGNVVITASDKKYALADISDSVITAYNAELPSTYDYYPFGMLMPGRFTSDTSTQCATITQTVMVPTVVSYTDPLTLATVYNLSVSALSGITANTINIATTAANQGITLSLANAEVFKENTFELTVNRIPTGLEYIAEIYEYNIGDTLLLTSMAVDRDATFTLHFKPCGSGNVGLVLKTINALSSGSTTKFKNFYTTVTTYTAQSITTTICNTGGDRYRFGFNGMEKDNELKGTGNSLDFGARMYDSRLGRWLSLDPLAVKYPSISPFTFVGNSPLVLVDPDGRKWVNYYDRLIKDKIFEYLCGDITVLDQILKYQQYQEIVNNMIEDIKFYQRPLYDYIENLAIVEDLITNSYKRDVVVVVRFNENYRSQADVFSKRGGKGAGVTTFDHNPPGSPYDAMYNNKGVHKPTNPNARVEFEAVGYDVEIYNAIEKDVALSNEAGDIMFNLEYNDISVSEKFDDSDPGEYNNAASTQYSNGISTKYKKEKSSLIKKGISRLTSTNNNTKSKANNSNKNKSNISSKPTSGGGPDDCLGGLDFFKNGGKKKN